MMTTNKKSVTRKESTADRFNELGIRERGVRLEEIMCHWCNEQERHPSGEDGPYFEAEIAVIIHLRDGRTLRKVTSIEFDAEDIS